MCVCVNFVYMRFFFCCLLLCYLLVLMSFLLLLPVINLYLTYNDGSHIYTRSLRYLKKKKHIPRAHSMYTLSKEGVNHVSLAYTSVTAAAALFDGYSRAINRLFSSLTINHRLLIVILLHIKKLNATWILYVFFSLFLLRLVPIHVTHWSG